MGYAVGKPLVWLCVPDWSNPVQESLGWLTDVMQASATGMQQVRQLRSAPRRGFSFESLLLSDERRIVDAFRRQIGTRQFLLPIYPDVQWLSSSIAAGTKNIICATTGFDFVAGGKVLFWRDVKNWEWATIDSMDVSGLTLVAGTSNDWGPGDRIYPLRTARLSQPGQETQSSSDISKLAVQALIDEPCDWTPAWPSTETYRSLPVLEWRGDESRNPTDQYDRVNGNVDADTGPVYYYDLPGMPFRNQSQQFKLFGRAEHTTFRNLAYQLAGRSAQCWVPDWQSSVRLVNAIGSTDTQIDIAWQGYTQFDFVQVNRRDLRIELNDGTVFYRRITGSAETGGHEVLQLDSAFGAAIAPAAIRQINFMSVCASASDTIQIQHNTDAAGNAVATINWEALANDV